MSPRARSENPPSPRDDADTPGSPGASVCAERGAGARAGFASHDDAVAYLLDRPNLERSRQGPRVADGMKLERMQAICAHLGSPERAVRYVHIAGSKGKGSTAHMLASAVGGCGYAAGLFTSPHLISVRERVRINGVDIGAAEFDEHLWAVREAAEAASGEHGEATYFELLTALAFLAFADQAVDLGVAEVGLGGRLDCTNVLSPDVCVLTRIQLEHTEILGDTVEQIAAEKAGIMKPGVPAISVAQDEAVTEVFRARAESVGCPLWVLGEDIEFSTRFEADPGRGPRCRISVALHNERFEHLAVPLLGHHQAENAAAAVAAVLHLNTDGFRCTERGVASGLERTPRTGRLEQVWDRPRVFVDGAHNPESVEALIRAVGTSLAADSVVVVFGCAQDKDVPGMIRALGKGADKIVFTRSGDSPRAMDPKILAERYSAETDDAAQWAPTVRDAINLAAKATGSDDLILVCGSFHVAGEAKELFERKSSGRL